jgi:2-C-methyl-D-erythritol 2,4-cyclodiphosphate synthase
MKKDNPLIRTGIGQNSRRFLPPDQSKPLVIGGIIFTDHPGFKSNSDGDVIFHALCNAITSLTHIQIIGGIADDLLSREGITDSEVYLHAALKTLKKQKITHVSITLEGKRPYFKDYFGSIRKNIARVLEIEMDAVGITAISGDGLSDFACGDGVQCFAIITTEETPETR